MSLFKKVYGHDRSASGKTLDMTVLVALIVVAYLLYRYFSS